MLDVQSGHRQVVHSSAEPFEAPNWTPDGKALIYNSSGRAESGRGRLHRFDLATRRSTVIDTGFAIRNNNDHVLSFDGTMLGISDQSTGDGQSTIFTLPAGGGTPKRITPLSPSYLHGWSPDGKFLVYTGGRGRRVRHLQDRRRRQRSRDRLTDFKGLDDGPEYTPGRPVHLLQLRAQRHDAALAHEGRRPGSRGGHERRVQQLVPAPLARRAVDRVPQLREGRRAPRTIRTTSTSTSG